jgi:hypothetical protein
VKCRICSEFAPYKTRTVAYQDLGQASDKTTAAALLASLTTAEAVVADRGGFDSCALIELVAANEGAATSNTATREAPTIHLARPKAQISSNATLAA